VFAAKGGLKSYGSSNASTSGGERDDDMMLAEHVMVFKRKEELLGKVNRSRTQVERAAKRSGARGNLRAIRLRNGRPGQSAGDSPS
jgi:hypothetical protein